MTPQEIELHIEELILEGFAPADRYSIAEAVQRELTRLLTERGAPPALAQGGEIASVNGGSFTATPNAHPEAVGAQVAQAVYGGLKR